MVSVSDRRSAFTRAGDRCEYCGVLAAPVLKLEIEHVVPAQHRGSDDLGNLAVACNGCNRLKGPNMATIDPATNGRVFLFSPRQDRWSEHFRVDDDGFVIGQTATGRGTVALLDMNEEHRRRLRRLLIVQGRWSGM